MSPSGPTGRSTPIRRSRRCWPSWTAWTGTSPPTLSGRGDQGLHVHGGPLRRAVLSGVGPGTAHERALLYEQPLPGVLHRRVCRWSKDPPGGYTGTKRFSGRDGPMGGTVNYQTADFLIFSQDTGRLPPPRKGRQSFCGKGLREQVSFPGRSCSVSLPHSLGTPFFLSLPFTEGRAQRPLPQVSPPALRGGNR